MRFRSTLLALLAVCGPAMAQVVSPLGGSTTNPQSPPPALAQPAAPAKPAARAHRTLAERFAAANTTHDGKLTLEQARSGHMRAVVRDFAAIDTGKTGYVTLDQIKAHQAQQRAAHRAAQGADQGASKPAQ